MVDSARGRQAMFRRHQLTLISDESGYAKRAARSQKVAIDIHEFGPVPALEEVASLADGCRISHCPFVLEAGTNESGDDP
jgi:hypothetical protein